MNTRLPAPPKDDEVDSAPAPKVQAPAGPKPPTPTASPKPQGHGGAPAPSKGTPEARNLPPVGDIQLSKIKGTYNSYKMELSYGQLEAIRSALEKDHAEPVSDELLQILHYYMDKLPGPGEEEEDIKARDEASKAGTAGLEDDDDSPLPAPPGMEDEGGEAPVAPGADDLGGEDAGEDTLPPAGGDGGSLPEAPGGDEADQRLEEPPTE